jgi:hypothetical protein
LGDMPSFNPQQFIKRKEIGWISKMKLNIRKNKNTRDARGNIASYRKLIRDLVFEPGELGPTRYSPLTECTCAIQVPGKAGALSSQIQPSRQQDRDFKSHFIRPNLSRYALCCSESRATRSVLFKYRVAFCFTDIALLGVLASTQYPFHKRWHHKFARLWRYTDLSYYIHGQLALSWFSRANSSIDRIWPL